MPRLPRQIIQVARARALRQSVTITERLLGAELRGHVLAGRRFRREVPLEPFIVDFLCHHARLVIEAAAVSLRNAKPEDGPSDGLACRARFSRPSLWERSGVDQLFDVVDEAIVAALAAAPPPTPPPLRGGGSIEGVPRGLGRGNERIQVRRNAR